MSACGEQPFAPLKLLHGDGLAGDEFAGDGRWVCCRIASGIPLRETFCFATECSLGLTEPLEACECSRRRDPAGCKSSYDMPRIDAERMDAERRWGQEVEIADVLGGMGSSEFLQGVGSSKSE